MPLLGAIFGATSGVIIRVGANALGIERYLARPWNHVIYAGVGGYIGYNYSTWSDKLLAAVNEKRVERGMPAIVREDIVSFNRN